MFTAKIPEHIIFNRIRRNKSNGKSKTRAKWDRLPNGHIFQKEARKFEEDCFIWNYWAPTTKIQIEAHNKRDDSHIHVNKPTKLQLVGWGYEGLSAALPSGHVIEMPLDIVYNSIRESGLEKDNKTLKGKFVLAMANRKLIPVKVGSGMHKAILDLIKEKNKSKIKVKELVVGNVYKTPAGNTALFCGYVNTETMLVDLPPSSSRGATPYSIYRNIQADPTTVQDFSVRFLKKKLCTLWFEVRTTRWDGTPLSAADIQKELDQRLSQKSCSFFKCKKSHRYTSKVAKLYVDLPTDIVMRVRNIFEEETDQAVMLNRYMRLRNGNYNHRGRIPANLSSERLDVLRHYDANTVAMRSAECNMTLFGLGIIRSAMCTQFKPWEKTKKKKPSKAKK